MDYGGRSNPGGAVRDRFQEASAAGNRTPGPAPLQPAALRFPAALHARPEQSSSTPAFLPRHTAAASESRFLSRPPRSRSHTFSQRPACSERLSRYRRRRLRAGPPWSLFQGSVRPTSLSSGSTPRSRAGAARPLSLGLESHASSLSAYREAPRSAQLGLREPSVNDASVLVCGPRGLSALPFSCPRETAKGPPMRQ